MNIKVLLQLILGVSLNITLMVGVAEDAPVVDANAGAQAQAQAIDLANTVFAAKPTARDDRALERTEISSDQSPEQATGKVSLPSDLDNMPIPQRVKRLEQQVNNIANMNLPQQIASLQQELAQIRGQLEVQGHDLQLLNKQLRSFYQDLDNRINQINNLNPKGNNSEASVSDSKTAASATSFELQDANAYQLAFNQLVGRQLEKSLHSFSHYINLYPNGKYVADAHYWLGEINLSQKKYAKAQSEFETVLSKYPKSAKIPETKLKIAIIHANTGNVAKAKSELRAIKKANPNSTAAQLASIRLQQLEN